MTAAFYAPDVPITGPTYSRWFKATATLVSIVLVLYGLGVALRFPVLTYGIGVQLLLLASALMLALSYYWFLRSTITIDARGITQTWLYDRAVEWREVRSAKMIGIPYAGWLFPPRLVIRTGNAFMTFNAGSQALLIEFAKISLAFQIKR